MRRILMACAAAALVIVLGCVNIPKTFDAHITVDIRHHIEEQASSVLSFIEGDTPAIEPVAAPEAGSQSWLHQMWEAISPIKTAYAATEMKSDSPEIRAVAQSMRERNSAVQALKKAQQVGESNRGYLELWEQDKISDPEKLNEAQRLVAAENKDRKTLYQEVARLNKDTNVSVTMVERVYAQERLKRAAAGEVVQLPPKGGDFDSFAASPAGKKLGTECQPEAWVFLK